MNYQLIVRKIEYYCNWWNDLSESDKRGWLGHWIRKRIEMYDECINRWVKMYN